MRPYKNIFLCLLFLILIISCKKESDKSTEAFIANFSVSETNRESLSIEQVYLDQQNQSIYIFISDKITPDLIPVNCVPTIDISPGASSSPASGETITFNSTDSPVKYMVTAENGTVNEYFVFLRDNQIPNSNFENWYSTQGMNGVDYKECGLSAESAVWATANYGTSVYSIYGTAPLIIGDNTLAKITTGSTTMVPVTAGTLFTGKFDIQGAIDHPTNPRMATNFGIPFCLRPEALKFKYSYSPGSHYVKATLNDPTTLFGGFTISDLEGSDKFTAYAYLQKRSSSDTLEIARAELTSGEIQQTMKEITLPFTYTSNEKPTHITIVFSSSVDGDLFTGAVGSELTVDDVELTYE